MDIHRFLEQATWHFFVPVKNTKQLTDFYLIGSGTLKYIPPKVNFLEFKNTAGLSRAKRETFLTVFLN